MRFCTSRSLNTRIDQRAIVGQPDELDLRDRRLCVRGSVTTPARCVTFDSNCDAAATSALESSREASRLAAQLGERRIVLERRARLQQRIDEEAIALVGGHAAGGGVRRANKAELLEVGHDVADGRRGRGQARLAGQGAGADRLPVADIAADQHPQQQLFAL